MGITKKERKFYIAIFLTIFLFGFILLLSMTLSSPNYILDGNSVYIDDANVFINVTPAVSNNPIISITPKTYTGDVDILFGFETDNVKPTKAETNPHYENVISSYTCEGDGAFFNYTTNPNHFWCWRYVPTEENTTTLQLIFDHDFEQGDPLTATANWTENKIIWDDISGIFNSINYNFENFDKWYYKKNIPVIKGNTYNIKIRLSPISINEPIHKYFFGIKPSSETLQEAISNGHFYYIDPWTDNFNQNLVSYYKLDESSGIAIDSQGNHSLAEVGTVNSQSGLIGTSRGAYASSRFVGNTEQINQTVTYTWGCWIYRTGTPSDDESIIGVPTINTGGYYESVLKLLTNNSVDFRISKTGVGQLINLYSPAVPLNTWVFVGATHDGTNRNSTLYYNGATYMYGIAGSNSFSHNNTMGIGSTRGGGNLSDAYVDECFFYVGKKLNATEFSDLNNSGAGLIWNQGNYPTIIINSPIDNYNSSSTSNVFSITPRDAQDTTNLWVGLYLNDSGWSFNQTNTSAFNNTQTNFTIALPDGIYTWAFYVNDTDNLDNTSSNRTIIVDTVPPIITLPTYSNATIRNNSQQLTLNISVSDATIGVDAYCFVNINGTNESIAVSSGWCNTTKLNLTSLSDGNKTINVYINDTVNNMNLNNSYTLFIDNFPPNVTITKPTGTYTTLQVPYNVTLNETSDYHTCTVWVTRGASTEVANTTKTCPSGYGFVSGNVTVSGDANYVFHFFANDTSGQSNSSTSNFTVSTTPSPGGGGGGGGTTTTISVVALIKPNESERSPSDLERAKLYASILYFCQDNSGFFGKCTSDDSKLTNLTEDLNVYWKIPLTLEELNLWISQYENDQIENVDVQKIDQEKWALVTSEVVFIESEFQVFPKNADRFWIAFTDTLQTNYDSNRVLKSCKIEGGDTGFNCSVLGAVATLNYQSFSSKLFETVNVKVSYVSIDDRTSFQNIQIRIIRPNTTLYTILGSLLLISTLLFNKKIRLKIKKLKR